MRFGSALLGAAAVLGAGVVAVLLSSLAIAQTDPRNDYVTCRKASAETAIAACDRALASRAFSGKELAAIHNNRGWAHYGMGQLDRAIDDYNESIRINPIDAVTFTNRAIAWHDKGDFDRALADTNEAVLLDPDLSFARTLRGLAWHGKGDFDNAIADHTEAIRLDPKDYGARLNRCWTRAAFNRELEQALADCNDGLRLEDPDEPGLHEARCFVYFRMGRMAEALADCDRTVKRDRQYVPALFLRGLIKLAVGDAGGGADVALAGKIKKSVVEEFARYGLRADTAKK